MDKIDEFFEVIQLERSAMANIQEGVKSFAVKADIKIIIDTLLENGFMDFVMKTARDIIQENFTYDEVCQLVGFYKTPAGQKSVRLLPALSERIKAKEGEWIERVWPKIDAILDLARMPAANKMES